MNKIRNDVLLPTANTRVCKQCGKNKPIKSFSLLRGKHSEDRKTICVTCEGKIRKARNSYDMELEEMEKFLSQPCAVCGNKSEKIQLNEYSAPIASLCKPCYNYLNHVEDEETLLHAYNHAIFVRDFPFYLRYQISNMRTPKLTPLLDLLDED
jgi:protein-arginine kinase activator protein McsA